MSNLPSIDLLESTHRFPCSFVFKVIGFAENDFALRVRDAVAEVLSKDHGAVFSERPSAKGRHISISVEVMVESAAMVHKLYEKFLTLRGLEMVL